MYSDDAKRGMARYVERASQYDSLDLEVVLEETKALLDGREVEYKGK